MGSSVHHKKISKCHICFSVDKNALSRWLAPQRNLRGSRGAFTSFVVYYYLNNYFLNHLFLFLAVQDERGPRKKSKESPNPSRAEDGASKKELFEGNNSLLKSISNRKWFLKVQYFHKASKEYFFCYRFTLICYAPKSVCFNDKDELPSWPCNFKPVWKIDSCSWKVAPIFHHFIGCIRN